MTDALIALAPTVVLAVRPILAALGVQPASWACRVRRTKDRRPMPRVSPVPPWPPNRRPPRPNSCAATVPGATHHRHSPRRTAPAC